jgi:ribosomal-protein-alanine N-acetyltransferase
VIGRRIELRFATADDAPAMHAIEVESFGDPWSAASFRSMLAHPQMHARVAMRGDVLLGYCIAWIVGDEAELANLAVTSAVRREGIGALLLDDLVRAVDGHGGATIWLEVREGNRAARMLYEGRGFRETGRRKGYYRAPVEDAIVMQRPAPADDGTKGADAR